MGTITAEKITAATLDRRSLLKRAGLLGVALPVAGVLLNACGGDDAAQATAATSTSTDRDVTREAAQAETGQEESAPFDAPYLPAPEMAGPVGAREAQEVEFELTIQEIVGKVDDGIAYEFWTFNDTVPGPLLRARVGDTILVRITNPAGNKMVHNIDLHAVNGPHGGGEATMVAPGESKAFRFKALNPGLFVYHCAVPPVPHHIMNGMYGMILIEPEGGLTPVDHEFYVMQGELYLEGERTQKGMRKPSMEKLLDERPDFIVFNGAVGALTGDRALKVNVGETVRIFFGVGGPNVTSSFHIIGEIFDRVYPEAASEPLTNVQTTLVPAGGATIVEFETSVPGTYVIVDHSLGRSMKGGMAQLVVEGTGDPAIFEAIEEPAA